MTEARRRRGASGGARTGTQSTAQRGGRPRAGRGSSRRPPGERPVPGRAAGRSAAAGAAGSGPGSTGAKDTGSKDTGSGAARSGGTGTGTGRGKGRISLTGRAAILTLVLAALVVAYASSVRTWVEQRSQISELRTEMHQRQERVDAMERTVHRWQDPAYVKTQARERFGWVMPGETGYIVIGADGQQVDSSGDKPVRTGADDKRPAWWGTFWGSVREAGRPEKPDPPADRKASKKKNGPAPAKTIGPTEPADGS